MTIITTDIFDVAAEAFFGKASAAAIDDDERDGLIAALEAAGPRIEAARLRVFADELMTLRDQVTCEDPYDNGRAGVFTGHKFGLLEAIQTARAAANGGESPA